MSFHKVIVLEDDADFRAEIVETLEDSFEVAGCGTINAFWQIFRQETPELVMLDLGLPDGRGSDLIRALRDLSSSLGILVLSGQKDEVDRVIALEFGADDFLVKPCGARELIARANAILRRVQPASDLPDDGPRRADFAGFSLDLLAMRLTRSDGSSIPLTTAEFELLKVFVDNTQKVLSRERLLTLLRGDDWAGYDRAIDGLVYRLRKKLKTEGKAQQILKTMHGSGYIFTADVALS